ncbi:MAG: hypothetical protein IKB70_06305 [Bacilli bacterium]|nr:hypothetical protein [Bacilli bacterium]
MTQSTETNIVEKRYLHLDRGSWESILTAFKTSPSTPPVKIINGINYQFSRPNKDTDIMVSIIKQPWLDYDMLEPSFVIIPHQITDENIEDTVKGFIIPSEWMDPEVWATDEQ